jgi:hypothetical protein
MFLAANQFRNAMIVVAAICVGWYVVSDAILEDNITLLGGNYYTASFDSGTALHWYENPDKPYSEPLLDKVFETRGNGTYLVARAGVDFYYVFPWRVVSGAEANRKRLGPFSKIELKAKLLQLSGDTTLQPLPAL